MKLTKKHKEAIKFCKISRDSFADAQTIYTMSACFGFAQMMKFVFPSATFWELTYEDETDPSHVMVKIDGQFFDINGLYYVTTEKVNRLSEYKYFGWEGNHQGMRAEWIINKKSRHYNE